MRDILRDVYNNAGFAFLDWKVQQESAHQTDVRLPAAIRKLHGLNS